METSMSAPLLFFYLSRAKLVFKFMERRMRYDRDLKTYYVDRLQTENKYTYLVKAERQIPLAQPDTQAEHGSRLRNLLPVVALRDSASG